MRRRFFENAFVLASFQDKLTHIYMRHSNGYDEKDREEELAIDMSSTKYFH